MTTRFRIGDRVRIVDRKERSHHRVPAYAKGCVGVIERACKSYGRPELLATNEPGKHPTTVYRVRLLQSSIWPDYDGAPHDTLDIEIFEHWLRPASDPQKADEQADGHVS